MPKRADERHRLNAAILPKAGGSHIAVPVACLYKRIEQTTSDWPLRLILRAKARVLTDQNGKQGQGNTQRGHGDQEVSQLAAIRHRYDLAGLRVDGRAGHHEDLVEIRRTEAARQQRHVRERHHHGKEGR